MISMYAAPDGPQSTFRVCQGLFLSRVKVWAESPYISVRPDTVWSEKRRGWALNWRLYLGIFQ
jgi:hypothetical protein